MADDWDSSSLGDRLLFDSDRVLEESIGSIFRDRIVIRVFASKISKIYGATDLIHLIGEQLKPGQCQKLIFSSVVFFLSFKNLARTPYRTHRAIFFA